MQQHVIRLVGPGGAGKTTTGAKLAEHLGVAFIDLDERFAAAHGDISEYLDVHGYTSYAMQNVHTYLDVMEASAGSRVLALSSGFMTYSPDVHPDYARARDEIAASATTLVLLPSLDYETCVTETVRRQLRRPFCRSAEREEEVIRQRFGVYRSLSAVTLETMKPIPEVVETAVMHLLPHLRLDISGARCPLTRALARGRCRLLIEEGGVFAVDAFNSSESITSTSRMLRYENPDGTGTVEVVVESGLDPADRIDPSLARRG